MPLLEKLRSLAEKNIEPIPPTWALVHYLIIEDSSPGHGNLGAIVAASGETSIFSYARDSIEPMYYSTIQANQRLKTFTGYSAKGLRTTDEEEGFSFLREGIDAGKGIFVAGPEMGLCYGYEDPGNAEGRKVYGISNWGPAFNGTYSWAKFSDHVKAFGDAEGFGYLHFESELVSTDSILRMLAMTVVDWQEKHVATGFGMKQDHYGLAAFKQFIQDVRDPETRAQVDEAYINCHAIAFQVGGRYWLGQYLKQLSEQFGGDMRERLVKIGDLYMKVHTELDRFQEFNITEGKNEGEVQGAVEWLETAYHADEQILEESISIRDIL